MDVIKVSSKSISQKVAGSIANSFREGLSLVEIQTVGAGAVNQAIKDNIDLIVFPKNSIDCL